MDKEPDEFDADIFAEAEIEEVPYHPGVDLDGKVRRPPFAGRFVAADSSLAAAGILRPDEVARKFPAGAVVDSPFA